MSIVVTHTPNKLTPVYNENYIRLIDSLSGQPNYKYVIKLYYKYTTAASFSLIQTFTQNPLIDGTMEFEPNQIFKEYMNNNDYDFNFGSWAYRASYFQVKIEVCRLLNNVETTIWTFGSGGSPATSYYVFDAAISQAEYDHLATLVADIKPNPNWFQVNLDETTPISWLFETLTNNIIMIFPTTSLLEGVSYVTISDCNVTAYNGNFNILQSVANGTGAVVKIDLQYTTTPTVYDVTINTYTEQIVDRSLSNTKYDLFLSKFDYYSADFFKHYYNTTQYTDITVGLEVHHDSGWKYYNSDPNPTNDALLEHDIISLGVGPMNIKGGVWTSGGGSITGEQLFNLNDFDTYKVYINTPIYTLMTNGTYAANYPHVMKPITVQFCRDNEIETLNNKSFDRNWLVYKSKLGGWSWLCFNMKSTKKQVTQNTTYYRRLKYNETYKNRGTTTISNVINQLYTLSTNWVDVAEWTFYEDLFSSPQVFMYQPYINKVRNEYDPFLPVQITTISTPIFKPNNDKLFQYVVEIEAAQSNIRQR